jgi:sensor c-di-GMP phosphodiesterase-like protein
MQRFTTFAWAGLAALLPVVFAVLFAFLLSLNGQRDRAATLAEEINERTASTSAQLWDGFTALAEIDPARACSPEGIMEMRRIALGSPYLAGLGYIAHDALQCSSFGNLPAPIVLGPADYFTANGFAIHEGRELLVTPGARVVLLSAPNGFTGFYHPAMVMGLDGDVADLSLGVVNTTTRRPHMSSGLPQHWADYPLPQPGQSQLSTADGQITAIVRPTGLDYFTYVVIPWSAVMADLRQRLWLFLLFGFLAAIPTFFVVRHMIGGDAPPDPAPDARVTLRA